VESLIEAFGEVEGGGGPRMIVLSAPSGEGKTRIVQEFYRVMASRQPHPRYWPDALDLDGEDWKTGRKKLRLEQFRPDKGATMNWLYWSLSCSRRADGALTNALTNDKTQFGAHADHLFERFNAGERGYDGASALVGMLSLTGLIFPPIVAGVVIVDATKYLFQNKDLIQRFWQWDKRRNETKSGDLVIDPEGHNRLSEADELAEHVTKVSKKIPIIIAVDDAHWADEFTVHFLAKILEERKAHVLVVATAWPETPVVGTLGTKIGTFTDWVDGQRGAGSARIEYHQLEPLTKEDLVALTHATYKTVAHVGDPDLRDDVAIAIADKLASPMSVRALFDLNKVLDQIHHGGLEVSHLTNLPHKLADILGAYWAELPSELRTVLAVAATYGERYAKDPVVAAAEQLEFSEAQKLLDWGKQPYGVTRTLRDSIEGFTDLLFHQIASGQSTTDFSPRQLKIIYDALANYAVNLEVDDDQIALAESVWSAHVALANQDDDGLIDLGLAARSAWGMAQIAERSYQYDSAVRYARLSLEWTSLESDNSELFEVRYSLFSWLGVTGRLEEAIREGRGLLDDELANGDADCDEILNTKLRLLQLLGEVGQFVDAITLCNEVLEGRSKGDCADPDEALIASINLAILYGSSGRVGEAIDLLEKLLEDQQELLEDGSRFLLTIRNNLAAQYTEDGQFEKAIELSQKVSDGFSLTLGANDPSTLVARANLAIVIATQDGRVAESVQLFTVLVDEFQQILGPTHPHTLGARVNLANLTRKAGRGAESLELATTLLADLRSALSDYHALTLSAREVQGAALRSVGRVEDAIASEEKLLSDRRRVLGPDHPSTLTSLGNLASYYCEPDQRRRSIALYQELLGIQQRLSGTLDRLALEVVAILTVQLLDEGRHEEVLAMRGAVLSEQISVLGARHPDVVSSQDFLLSYLRTAGLHEEAIEMAENLIAERSQLFGDDASETIAAKWRLASNLMAAGRGDEAIMQTRDLAERLERVFGGGDDATKVTRRNLAIYLATVEHLEEAIALCRENLAREIEHSGPGDPASWEIWSLLVTFLTDAELFADARAECERLLEGQLRSLDSNHEDAKATRERIEWLQDLIESTSDVTH
jgi:tetratricopeptide (TPR) repeat protein